MNKKELIDRIIHYCENEIRPIYSRFDLCHDINHFDEVFEAAKYAYNKAYKGFYEGVALLIAAAYHDIGRIISDEDHEKYSVQILNNDYNLYMLLKHFEDIDDTEYDYVIPDFILSTASFAIGSHRRKYHKDQDGIMNYIMQNKDKYTFGNLDWLVEICRIVYDCDKANQSVKDRVIYRYIGYYFCRIDTDYKNPTYVERLIEDRYKKIGGTYEGFVPRSNFFSKDDKYLKGAIKISKADIKEILREKYGLSTAKENFLIDLEMAKDRRNI